MSGDSTSVALVLVRNTVTHDARVVREAQTLRQLGFEVLIAGVVSTEVQERHADLAGFPVTRLDPGRMIRRGLARIRGADRPLAAAADRRAVAAVSAGDPNRRSLVAALRRVALAASYYVQGIALVLERRPSLVHANDYNTMWIGIAAKLLFGSKLVYDCHELWPDRNRRPEWRSWLIACEAMFVRIADATITTSPGYAREMARRYRVPAPTLVRNIPAATARPTAAVRGARAAPRPACEAANGSLAAYVGGLLPGRGLEQAIRALAGAPQVRLRLIGPGSENYRGALLQVAEEAGVADRTEFVAPVAPAAVLEAIADADFGVMLIEPVCRSYELTLPNKLFEYAGAGLPILASNLPVIASVVREQQLGEVVPPDSPELIGRAMVRLADPAHNRQLREHVASFASRSTWESEQQILERVYRDLQPAADGPAESPADAARSQEQERIRRAYDRYAHDPRKQQDWAADNPGNDAIRSELVQRVFTLAGPALQDARRVLDIGCGTGWWLATLTGDDRVSAELHGLELLPERASAAADRVPRAEIATGDARALPYDDQSFDVVTLFTVLSSLAGADDAERALREARRVLANSGMLLIWEPRLPNPLNRSTRLITRGLIGSALSGMELDVRTLTVLPPVARRLGSRTARLYPILAALPPLRTHRLTCARKSSDGGMELHPEATPGLD